MRIIIFIVIIVLFNCCTKKKEQLQLVDNFYSYQSHDDVRHIVDSIEFKGIRGGLSTGKVDFKHLSEDGKLGLLFFEDQLVSVGFYPKDTTSYLNKLEEMYGPLTLEEPINYNGVLIQKGFDYEMGSIGGLFISWADPDLKNKYEGKVW